jgi:hypothetical protein
MQRASRYAWETVWPSAMAAPARSSVLMALTRAIAHTYPRVELAREEGHRGGRAGNDEAPMAAQASACT